ncbi:8928_t:CDS:10, partial [Acaulospora morrowiae]
MHDAFKVSVALDKLQQKIESIFAYGQKLFIGTSSGALLVYEVKEPLGMFFTTSDPKIYDEPLTVTLVETHKNFSKKLIEQLDVIKEIGVLVSLSDGCVNIYDLNTLELQSQLSKTRGANLFAIDTQIVISEGEIPTIVTRLAVAVRRKLLVLTWEDTEFTNTKELSLPDRVRAMAWVSSDKICLGLATEYALMDISTGALTALFSPSSAHGGASFSYMGMIGSKVTKPMVTKLPNDEILLAKDNVSIFVGLDGNPTRRAGIDWSATPEDIGYSYPYLIAILPKHVEVRNIMTQTLVQTVELPQARFINKGKYLYVASYNSVWRFISLNFEKQIDQLVAQYQYEEAISLTKQIESILLDDKDAKLRQIRMLHANYLFRNHAFDEAITIFQNLEADPADVVALYPPSISGALHVYAEHNEAHKNEIDNTENGSTTDSELDEKHQLEKENVVKETKQNTLEGKLLEDAVSALIRFLTDRRQKISKILHKHQVLKSSESTPPGSPNGSNHINGNHNHLLEAAELVDTALLKSYMIINDALVGPLLRVPNHCNVEESEGLLLERKKYRELVDLYKGKGLHRKSLELLKKLGQSEGPMSGTFHTILYLQRLGVEHFDLMLEYAKWVMDTDPERGMDIFIDDHLEIESLPRDKVLSFLEGFSYDLCITYLEHIIYELEDQTSNHHNKLITTYLNKIQQLSSQIPPEDSEGNERGLLLESIEVTTKKLLKFLEESTHYKVEKILGQLPLDDFYEVRAILLSRLGQHDQALNIYVHKLKNEEMAEEYCVKNYNESGDDSKNVFLSLLRVYLRPTNGEEVMIEPALRLLSRHGSHVNASAALNMLPPSTKVSHLYSFFEKYIRESNRYKNMNMIVKNLLRANQHQIEEQLMYYRSRRVKIDEDRMCPQCNRRIGPSVFAVFPNGVVVHFHCKEK